MLKFARHPPGRASSVDRVGTRIPRTGGTTTAAAEDRLLRLDSTRSRTSSLERVGREARRRDAAGAEISPFEAERATSPPPLPARAGSPPPRPPVSPRVGDPSADAHYEAIFSGTLCRGPAAVAGAGLRGGLKRDPAEPQSEFHKNIVKLVEKLDLQLLDTSSESGYGSDQDSVHLLAGQGASPTSPTPTPSTLPAHLPRRLPASEVVPPPPPRRGSRGPALPKKTVRFDAYVMLLQGLRERNLDAVRTYLDEVCDEALATEEVVNACLRAAVEDDGPLLRDLLGRGFDVNAADPAGLTLLHLAATFNNLPLARLLLARGAAPFARTHSRGQVPSELCSRRLPGFQACRAYLRCTEECLGVANGGLARVARAYRTSRRDELGLLPGETLRVLRRGDYPGSCWWWCQNGRGEEGYALRDLLAPNPAVGR